MRKDIASEELLGEFARVMEEVGPQIARKYKWQFRKLFDNEYVLEGCECELHFLLYLGHSTNLVVTLTPKGKILRNFAYQQMGIYYTLTEDQAKKCASPICTKQDIQPLVHHYVDAINESCIRLMSGDMEEWLRYKSRVDRAVADGLIEYKARLDKASQRSRRIYGRRGD